MITRYVLSAVCANVIFAASAGGAPVNLALGKKVIYAVMPDNPQDNAVSKLTDGLRNLPPGVPQKSGHNDYFDESQKDYTGKETMLSKYTVGWHWKGSGDIIHGIPLAVDLEKPEIIREIRLRAATFTRAMYRFSLPREFIFVGSVDGKNFYRIGAVAKVTSNGRDAITSGTQPLKIKEDRNRWVTIKIDAKNISARYVGVIVKAEGFMYYLDEIEVIKVKNATSPPKKPYLLRPTGKSSPSATDCLTAMPSSCGR